MTPSLLSFRPSRFALRGEGERALLYLGKLEGVVEKFVSSTAMGWRRMISFPAIAMQLTIPLTGGSRYPTFWYHDVLAVGLVMGGGIGISWGLGEISKGSKHIKNNRLHMYVSVSQS